MTVCFLYEYDFNGSHTFQKYLVRNKLFMHVLFN